MKLVINHDGEFLDTSHYRGVTTHKWKCEWDKMDNEAILRPS